MTACPICWTEYIGRRIGSRCGDTSQGQARPCVGLLMSRGTFHRSEWRGPTRGSRSPSVRAILAAEEMDTLERMMSGPPRPAGGQTEGWDAEG